MTKTKLHKILYSHMQSVDNSNSNGYNNTVLAITQLGTAQNEFFIHEENQTSLAHTVS